VIPTTVGDMLLRADTLPTPVRFSLLARLRLAARALFVRCFAAPAHEQLWAFFLPNRPAKASAGH